MHIPNIHKKGNKHERFDIDPAVTLYVEFVGDIEIGEGIDLSFEDVDENGWKKVANVKGTVEENGILVIQNFKLERDEESESEKQTEE